MDMLNYPDLRGVTLDNAPGNTRPLNELASDIEGFDLCWKAEMRMARAFEDRALIVVNGLMLIKAVGEPVGIALQEQTVRGGIIRSETWYELGYEPSDWGRMRAVRKAFIEGETHIDLPGITRWITLREVESGQVCPGEDLTIKAQTIASSLQRGTPMPKGRTREEYAHRYSNLW